ncbi:hypothetical protein JIG36_23480 [Actinoplanes sp. LDG1-06]|uniref:Uncharacterized protein n=1 Tax=Paractinoplanes ovalisporus TaxID=2810368 RepID=A0ABS2AFC5_9ACTN|nr:hypothetical protein [Actinoplanes ovalisporus]MBM2618522.1 hypothetical protein [Actinoplanes ovalisporus]
MEVLVLVRDPDRYAEAIDAWRQSATVTQELRPWLALVSPAGPQVPEIPGTRWFAGDVPEDVLGELPPAARLFVAAWRQRQEPKDRPGDGLPWDTPGHLPPDRGD